MKVLITGGAGYIGSHIAWTFQDANIEVVIVDNFSTGHLEIAHKFRHYKANIRQLDQLRKVFSQEGSFDVVIHMADFSIKSESVVDPLKYYHNNNVGMISLLQVMQEYNCNNIIFTSSAAVYGSYQGGFIDENFQSIPDDPYGHSKKINEIIIQDCAKAYGLNYIIFRCFNAVGACPQGRCGEFHSPETHLVPSILNAIVDNSSFQIFGDDYSTDDGTCVRDYIHTCDLAQAYLLASEHLMRGGNSDIFNLGNGCGVSVKQMIEIIQRVTYRSLSTITKKRRPQDPAILVSCNEKARNILKWRPSYSVESAVEHAWKWLQSETYQRIIAKNFVKL